MARCDFDWLKAADITYETGDFLTFAAVTFQEKSLEPHGPGNKLTWKVDRLMSLTENTSP